MPTTIIVMELMKKKVKHVAETGDIVIVAKILMMMMSFLFAS
jgi:hypothetical protein